MFKTTGHKPDGRHIVESHKICVLQCSLAGIAHCAGLQIRVRTGKIFFLISQQKHMLWVLKRTVSMRRGFLSTQNTFKLKGNEINAILGAQTILIGTYVTRWESSH